MFLIASLRDCLRRSPKSCSAKEVTDWRLRVKSGLTAELFEACVGFSGCFRSYFACLLMRSAREIALSNGGSFRGTRGADIFM